MAACWYMTTLTVYKTRREGGRGGGSWRGAGVVGVYVKKSNSTATLLRPEDIPPGPHRVSTPGEMVQNEKFYTKNWAWPDMKWPRPGQASLRRTTAAGFSSGLVQHSASQPVSLLSVHFLRFLAEPSRYAPCLKPKVSVTAPFFSLAAIFNWLWETICPVVIKKITTVSAFYAATTGINNDVFWDMTRRPTWCYTCSITTQWSIGLEHVEVNSPLEYLHSEPLYGCWATTLIPVTTYIYFMHIKLYFVKMAAL